MDDGRCLLDVIGDPIALDEFLQNEDRQLQPNLYSEVTDDEQINYPSSQQLLSPTDLILPQSDPQPSYLQTSLATSDTLDAQAVSSTTHGDEFVGKASPAQQNAAGSDAYNPQAQFVQVQQSTHVHAVPSSASSNTAIPVATIKPYAETPALQVLNGGSSVAGGVEDSAAQVPVQLGQTASQVQEQPAKAAPTAQTPGGTLHYLAPGSTIIARNAAGQPVTLSGTMLQAVQSMTQSLGPSQAVGQPIQIIPSNQLLQQGGALAPGRVMALSQVIIGGAPGQQITLVQAPPKATPKVSGMQTIIASPQVVKGPANIQPKPAGGTVAKTPISIRPVQTITIPTQTLQAGAVPQNYQIITHPTLGPSVMVSTASQDQTQQPQVVSQLLQPAASSQQENNNSSSQQQSYRLVPHQTSGQILQIPTQAVQQGNSSGQQQQQSYRIVQQQSTGQPFQVASAQQDSSTPVQQTYQIVNQPVTGQGNTLTKTLAHQQGTGTSQPGIVVPQQAVVLQNQTVLSNYGTTQKVHPVITIGTSQGNIIVMTQAQPVASTTTTQSGVGVAPELATGESQAEPASSKAKKSSRPSKKKKTTADIAPKTGIAERASPLQTPAQAIQRVPTHQSPATVVLQTDFTITPNAQGIPTMTISKAGSHPTSAQTTQLSVTPQVTQSTYQVSSVSVQQKQPDAKAQALLDADQQQFQLYQKVLKLQQAQQQQQQQHQQQAGQQLQQAGQPGGPTSHGAQQAIQQALRLSQQQAQLSAQQAQLKAQLSLQQVQPAQQILQAAPGQLAQQDQQQQQQQGTLTASQQQAQQTVEQVLQSSQMAYTSQQQLLSLSSQGLQSQTSSSQPPLSQPQMAQSSQPTADQQTPLVQQQQQQSKPGTRQMTIGQALLALINQSGKGQQITSQQQLQQFIQANPHFLKQLQMTLQQQKQQQQLQLQQQSQSAQPQAASSQPGDLQASSAQQSQGTPQLASANSNSDKSATQVQPSLEQGLQVLPQTRVTAVSQQQAVSSQVPHTFGGLGSAAIHLARLRQQKQQQQQQQSSALPVDQQGANGGTSPQQAVAQSQLQQQISQGVPGQQAGLAQAKQSPLLGQLTSVVQTSQSLDQPSQGSLQIGQGNLFQMTSQNVAAAPAAQVTVQQQLQQQRQLGASSAVVQVQQQSTSQIGADQLSQGGPAQVQVGTPAGGLQVQTVQRAGDDATQQGVQVQYQGQQQQGMLVQQRVSQHQGMEVPPNVQLQAVHQQHSVQEQQQGMQQQQQGMLVQQQGVQMQQQPQGGEQGSSSGITQVSSQAPSGRQQVIQQISIQAQRQLQLVQSHIRQLGALASPTDQQKNMLAQLQSLQQKIVQQARQQLSQYLASGASQQQKPTSTSQATTGAAATLQSQGLSQSTPAFASAQKPAAGAGQVLSQSLNSKDALQQQQQQQGAQQLASAVATAAAIQASLKGAAQAGNSTLTPKQRLLVRQLQEHLKKVTPEQQQQFYKMHQPLLLKIQAQARSSSSQPAVAPHPQQITQQQVSSSSPTKKNIAIKPAIASKPVASKEPPKEILPKPEKEKHKHKSKHKDKDKERERDKEREKEREKEKDKLSKKPKPTPLAKQLAQDQASAEKADTKKPFTTASKAIKRLLPFHLCQDKTATDKQLALTDEIFETKCIGLMDKKQRMLDKYQLLLYNESMRLRPSAEVVMIERMFLSDERNKLEADKKLAAANKELLHSSTSISNTLTISGHPSTVNTTTTTTSLPAGSTIDTSAKVKLGQKMDTPILRELVTSSSIPQNLLSPRIAAALTEVVATKMASTARSADREGGAMAKENGALESSSSESGDSLRNGSGDGPDSPRLPPKKRKVDMSAYLIEDSAGPNEGNIENHVKLKLKRKPAAEMMDPGREVPSARHLSDKIPGVSEVEISHPTNQRRLTPDRRPSFQDTFLKSIGIEEKAVSNTIMPVQEELRENKEVEEAPVQDEESDEKISVVDLQEQMECAINSILDLQRQEPVPKSPGLNCPKVLQDIAVVKPAIPQMKPQSPREVQELGSDGMNFDDQSALSDIDFESHTNSIEYDLGHIGDTFPFDTDDQTQFLPDRNTDIFHTDISSSSYPPAPTATAINASPVPEHVINEDTESSLYSSCGVEKQHPASESARNGYGNTNDDSPLLDESSVVAQFQSELSMLQHRQAEEEQGSEEEFFTGGTGTETAETDPDLEAAVNSILF